MRFLPLIWGSVWRNRTEALLRLLATSVGFALFSTMITLNAAYEQAIRETRSDRLIISCAFDCGAIPLGYREALAHMPGVSAVAGLSWLGGHEQDLQHRITIMFVDEQMRRAWPELPMSAANWRAFDRNPMGIFLTRSAAARRNLEIGDAVTLDTGPGSRADGTGVWPFTVLGFIPDPPGWGPGAAGPSWNPDTIVGNMHYLQNSEDLFERGLTNILRVAVERPEDARAACREIEHWFTNASPAVYCVPAREGDEEKAEASINMRQISLGIGAAGLFMILFLCGNAIAESVRERRWEFGVMKALGFSDGTIAWLVILEAAVPTLLGALIGSLAAHAAATLLGYLVLKGTLDMPRVTPTFTAYACALVAAMLVALASSVAPLYWIRRTPVATVVAAR